MYTSASIVFAVVDAVVPGAEASDDPDGELLSGESDRLSIVSGGGIGRRVRPSR